MKGISMKDSEINSPVSPDNTKYKKRKVNWHETAACAIQIELRDFTDIL